MAATLAIMLTALAGAANIAALAFGRLNAAGTSRAIPWMQRGSSLLLAASAWLLYLAGDRSLWPLAVAVGMSLSYLADLIMAEVIKLPSNVLGGMLAFGLAHCAYIVGMRSGSAALGLPGLPQAIGVALLIGVALAYWRLAVDTPRAPMALRLGALGYLALLSGTAGVAAGMAFAAPQLWPLAAGALLFFISDAILGNQIFREHNWPYVGDVVWLTYIVGQAGIVWGSSVVL